MAALNEINPEFHAFFAHLREGRVAFPRCNDCGKLHWYPMKLCPHCQSSDIGWQPMRGPGELWSWTIVRHPFDPSYADKVPYVVALVTYPDAPGIRLIANIEGVPLDGLKIGMPLELAQPASNAEMPRVLFHPVKAAQAA